MTGRPPGLFSSPKTPPPPEPPIRDSPGERSRAPSPPHRYSVRELNRRIAETLTDAFPRELWLEGELSEVHGGRGGHLYLTFAEAKETLRAVAWASDARHFGFVPARGDRVRVRGRVRTYAPRSQYQLIVSRVERTGTGELLLALRELEERLEAEGLFAPERKRPPPFLPRRIGLLAAKGSEAHRDFVTHARARFPGIAIRFRDTRVQGPMAVRSLVTGLRELARAGVDLIVLTRGGGSVEDLLPFSDEAVVRAAAACPTPVVSAVGHEGDRPLLDRAADVRASTPTAAAKEVVPELEDLIAELSDRRESARTAARRALRNAGQRCVALRGRRGLAAIPNWIRAQVQDVRADRSLARGTVAEALRLRTGQLTRMRDRLGRLAPARRLQDQRDELRALRDSLARLPLLERHRATAAELGERLRRGTVARFVAERIDQVQREGERARGVAAGAVGRRQSQWRELGGRLNALDPRAVLRRGYSLALDAEGRALRAAEQARVEDPVRLLLGSGALNVRVEAVLPDAPSSND